MGVPSVDLRQYVTLSLSDKSIRLIQSNLFLIRRALYGIFNLLLMSFNLGFQDIVFNFLVFSVQRAVPIYWIYVISSSAGLSCSLVFLRSSPLSGYTVSVMKTKDWYGFLIKQGVLLPKMNIRDATI